MVRHGRRVSWRKCRPLTNKLIAVGQLAFRRWRRKKKKRRRGRKTKKEAKEEEDENKVG